MKDLIAQNIEELDFNDVDNLIWSAVFSSKEETRNKAKEMIFLKGLQHRVVPSSIQNFYDAMGRGELHSITVPAVNIRGLTYYAARAIFRSAMKNNVGLIIFEIARSEIGYTYQSPSEYTANIIAAALREGFYYPIFLQGDHFQVNKKNFEKNHKEEIDTLKNLIKESINAGFFNIDIYASTMVDYSKKTLKEQQKENFTLTAMFTDYIRVLQPDGITVSVGGEIGHIGGKNSTVEEFEAFMEGYLKTLNSQKGISKISVQTGTAHGGIPLKDGTLAQVKLDFNVLKSIGSLAQEKYGLSGAVQHGASTLPMELFDKFPESYTSEIHLATGFQNTMYDLAPDWLKKEIYQYLQEKCKEEWKQDMTYEQFIYKTRKKGFGPFKKQWWSLPEDIKNAIMDELSKTFDVIFEKLRVKDSIQLVNKYINPVNVSLKFLQ
ncbi:class II fructose-bisphosphate aldolase [Thermodesulfovibrio sp. 3462-1]|uniref:Class II fructose-bisphosphate aldolase n=1 Tax=Thermodesulfovibrio obliviosus TaxID=3118332 RepID=A0AAU8H6R4_9BACT